MIPARWVALRAGPSPQRPLPRISLVILLRLLFATGALSGDTPASSSASSSQISSGATSAGVDAFEAFFWRYERDILGYLWRLTGDEQAAYDLSQETFVRAWQHFDRIASYERPGGWLFRVATNLALTLEAIEKLGASREMRSANVEQTRRTALQAIRDRPT